MGGNCPRGEFWDSLVKKCFLCHLVCKQPHVTQCQNYCESLLCREVSGQYYDILLKKCMKCTEVCGKHPAECSQHCQTTTLPVTTPPFTFGVTPRPPNSEGSSLPLATSFLYALVALSMVLLVSSLFLALAVFLRRSRTKSQTPTSKESKKNQGGIAQPNEKVRGGHQATKDFVTNSNGPTDREPSVDSSPTETCVCVHCFPDLKTLGQGTDKPFSVNQQAVLSPRVDPVKDVCLQTALRLQSPGMQVPTELWQGEEVHPLAVKSSLLTEHGDWMNEFRANQI